MFADEITKLVDGKIKDNAIGYKVTLLGDFAVIVEGTRRLVYFGDDEVKFSTGKRVLTVKGEGLKLASCNGNEHFVTGRISSVCTE